MGYIIAIARLPRIYGNVNRPCPRACALGLGSVYSAVNPWSRAITITCIGYITKCRCLRDLHTEGRRPRGGVNREDTEPSDNPFSHKIRVFKNLVRCRHFSHTHQSTRWRLGAGCASRSVVDDGGLPQTH